MRTDNGTGIANHLNGVNLNRIVGRSAVASKLRRDVAANQNNGQAQLSAGNDFADGADRLKKACVDFESVLMNMMFQAMRKTVPKDGLFGDSLQQDIFNSMYYQKLAQGGAEGEGLGLAATLYDQLSADETV
ncbi:MAG: rod-binding protein [Thermodesulfobacteriota bacterium]|nr:rod-binding protein [Thermodesulfobacteriota bacterium]